MPESASKRLLARLGVTIIRGCHVTGLNEALDGATKLGYPVVAKTGARGFPHKSELGLVRVDLCDRDPLESASRHVTEVSGFPELRIESTMPSGIESVLDS